MAARSIGRSAALLQNARATSQISQTLSRTRYLSNVANQSRVKFIVPQIVHQRRWKSEVPKEPWPVWQFKQIQELSQQKDQSDTIIIDVREPHEYVEGHIPNAVNMPINSAPEGLFLSEEDFEDRFGFEKPAPDTPVVFYCKAGIRSKGASIIATDAGLKNIKEYRPSYDDWTANGGAVERGKAQPKP